MSRARLVLQADDFGMCEAVNDGIAQAFRAGTISQASVMVPCPAFEEAAALARELDIPVGVHGTLNCEWDHLRWSPLTDGPSLIEADGTQHRTVESAVEILDAVEAGAELLAQHARLEGAGLAPAYFDCHMGPSSRDGYAEACRRTGLPFLYPMLDESLRFDSIAMLSDKPAGEKKNWLRERVAGFEPGSTHLIEARPHVAAWLTRTRTGQATGEFLPEDRIPEGLASILSRCFRDQLPFLADTQAALTAWRTEHPDGTRLPRSMGRAPVRFADATGERTRMTYALWMLQRVLDTLPAARPAIEGWLSEVGGDARGRFRRGLSGDAPVQYAAQRVDIGPRSLRAGTVILFKRRISGGNDGGERLRMLTQRQTCRAEINQRRMAVFVHQNVIRRDVTVQDVVLMNVRHRVQNLDQRIADV